METSASNATVQVAQRKLSDYKKPILIGLAIIIALVALFAIIDKVSESNKAKAEMYDDAIEALEQEEYADAINYLTELGNYKDSAEKLEETKSTAYEYVFDIIEKKCYSTAVEICEALGDYKDCKEIAEQVDSENSKAYTIYGLTNITEEDVANAIATFDEFKYVENDGFYRMFLLYELTLNKEWKLVSGTDLGTILGHDSAYPTLTTCYAKQRWDEEHLILTNGEDKFEHGMFSSSTISYNEEDNTYVWTETSYSKVDFTTTINLTDRTLNFRAEHSDGSIEECTYERID